MFIVFIACICWIVVVLYIKKVVVRLKDYRISSNVTVDKKVAGLLDYKMQIP